MTDRSADRRADGADARAVFVRFAQTLARMRALRQQGCSHASRPRSPA